MVVEQYVFSKNIRRSCKNKIMRAIQALAKRFFVIPYLCLCGVASLHASWQLWTADTLSLPWLGAFLAVTPVLVFVPLLYLLPLVYATPYIFVQLATAMLGALLVIIDLQPLPTLYGLVLGLGGVFTYVFWYSFLDRQDNPLMRVGRKLPAFSLSDGGGREISSDSFLGKRTVFVFLRGNWCPLCRTQLRDFIHSSAELAARGVQLILVAPAPMALGTRLLSRHGVEAQILIDQDLSAAKALGIEHENGVPFGVWWGEGPDTVMPSLLYIDEAGIIRYTDLPENFRAGPRPGPLLQALEGYCQ